MQIIIYGVEEISALTVKIDISMKVFDRVIMASTWSSETYGHDIFDVMMTWIAVSKM